MLEFKQLVSVNFEGLVVVLGRNTDSDDKNIYFNVLGMDDDVNDPQLDWVGFTKLDIPQQVRQIGMSIITLATDASTLVPTAQPFRVVTDQKYISVIQQSTRGTLYVNRFRLLKTKSGTDQKSTSFTLSPAWEVRYARSHKEDVPADSSDTQSYVDPNGDPFLEPSLELSMIGAVTEGAFDVVILPKSSAAPFSWQFLALDKATSEISMYNIPSTEDGLFDLTSKPLGANFGILPDSVFAVKQTESGDVLPIQSPPRVAVYVKHEKVIQPDGSSIGVKRAARAMIAIPVKVGDDLATVTVDTAISTQGTLADLKGEIVVSDIVPAEFDLVFDGVSYLTLNKPSGDDPLAIVGPYAMSFLICPFSGGDNVMILGGTASGNDAAPFVQIVDGNRIEVGFGTGSSVISCKTLNQILIPEVWSEVGVSYSGAGADPFTITINGSVVPVTPCTADAEPSGTPVSQIGEDANGFRGALNTVTVDVAGIQVLNLPCNSVDYSTPIPTTPNDAASGVTVTVFGPKPEPSSSPVNADMSGTFYIDNKGLTYYAGLADFIQPQSSTCLIDGSDGLLHLYYQGQGDDLSVAQFSTKAARTTFYADWSTNWGDGDQLVEASTTSLSVFKGWQTDQWNHVATNVLVAPDGTQTGYLNFVAHRVGAYMNATEISVTSSETSPFLCDVTVAAPSGVGTETWTGIPRDVDQFSLIWNGAGIGNPDNKDVINNSKPFFDYSGTVRSVIAPSTISDSGGFYMFTSVPFLDLDLASVKIRESKRDDQVGIDIKITAPSNWETGDRIEQNWPKVPADPAGLRDVFGGTASKYDYSKVTTPGVRAYGLAADTARSDAQISYVTVFVKDALESFAIKIEAGKRSDLCNVTINGVKLANVSRDQISFATTLNGKAKKYAYPDGYIETIANKIYALTNGLSAAVQNLNGDPTDAGALAYAGLLRVLPIGSESDLGQIAPLEKTTAEVIQGASLTFNGDTEALLGSALFGAIVVSSSTDGGVGRLENTASFTGGQAPVLAPGVNGGWMAQAARFCLQFNKSGSNYVSFDVDKTFSPANELAVLTDMTVEAWLNQDLASTKLQSRALTYNVPGNFDYPNEPIQYLVGSKLGPGLIVDKNTFVQSSFNFEPPNLTVQVYIKMPTDVTAGTVLDVSQVRGGEEFVSMSVNQFGKLEVTFLGKKQTLTSTSALPPATWACVTLSVADAGQDQVTLALYLDDAAPDTVTVANSFTGDLGNLMVGSQTGAGTKASLNGAAFWQRALSAEEVINSVKFGFADNDAMLGIRWNFAEGDGIIIMNSAATGPDYDGDLINPASPSWDDNGAFFVPYLGRNDYVLASNRILKGWTHVALSSQQGFGLGLDGSNSGIVSDGSNFNPGSSFALEAWVKPNALNSKQIITEKPGSYSYYINTLGQVCLDVKIIQDGEYRDSPPVRTTFKIATGITANKTSYVAVNFSSGTNDDDTGSTEYVKQTYFLTMKLFVDGVLANTVSKTEFTKPVAVEASDSSFYLGKAGDDTFAFEGLISHVRAWSRVLGTQEIAQVNALHLNPANTDGLVAGWNFDEQSGKVATDITGNVKMALSSNQLWTLWQDVAQASVFVNGQPSLGMRLMPSDVGGYGAVDSAQFTIGGLMDTTGLLSPFVGEVDDVRLFSVRLTQEQVREAMNKPLTGVEDNLAGYWKIDAGSGDTVFDMRGMGNNGTLMPAGNKPLWRASTAPIKNEGASVVNVLDGGDDNFIAKISGEPSVIEFASAEKDAYDNVYSIMKRGYFFLTSAGSTVLETGYKVGDLDTIYVGQVQSKPSVVGFIEGGPPIPSENQTLAYWSGDDGGPARYYAVTSTVTYQESESNTWSFSADQTSMFTGAFNIKGGFYQKSKSEVSVGLGAEAETQVLENEFRLGAKFSLSGDIGSTSSVAQSHTSGTILTNSLTPAGEWEPADNILNDTVGRRYIQNNIGMAVVKSATADLFMMALKGTQTPVGYSLLPNTTIPVDTNMIDFPINPTYIKNGTLDGKVGFVNDPDYPNADAERGSYFKPVEAYALKRDIEKKEQDLAAYYDQFSADKYRVVGSLSSVKDKLGENPAFDFSKGLNQRSIFNNYVWTAAGGLHKEEHSVANSYSESYTGKSSLQFALGAELKLDIGTPFGGYYMEADAMLGGTFSMTATKTSSSSNAFNLACAVTPTDFLPAPKMSYDTSGNLQFDGYNTTPAPGKVDAYRYMSFLLAPSDENFTELMKVIDPNWLNNSTTAAAAAMREAVSAENGCWRILYRTTYVSRVPAPFQPVKDDTNAPNITPPANLASNYWLVNIIAEQITAKSPTPLEIGTAIDVVLGAATGGPGMLKDLIPWWSDFYTAAREYGSVEFIELAELRIDLLEYMISKYEAEQYFES